MTTRRSLLIALVAALLGACPAWAAPGPWADVTLVVLHTNDLHGHLSPDEKGRGGMARLATLVQRLRSEHPGRVLVMDAGDIVQGTPVSNLLQGRPMFEVLDRIGLDAGTVGNHEFDWGPAAMLEMTGLAGYPLVCANLVTEEGLHPFPPYLVKEVGGVKVGILGLVAPETPTITKAGNTEGYRFLDPAETVREQLPRMRADGAEVALVVSHVGVEADRALAQAVPGIDAIVGGHSHTALEGGVRVGDTLIVQSGKYARNLGVLELDVRRGAGVVAARSRLIPVEASVEPDPQVAALVDRYEAEVAPLMAEVVGSAAVEIGRRAGPDHFDAPLGNLITDALATQTGADVALYNAGGIRTDALPAGDLTMGKVYEMLPFDDGVVVVELTGENLLELLHHGAFRAPGKVQVSGLEMAVDPEAEKVLEVRVGGRALDARATYRVAATEFLAGGGDGYAAFKEGRIVERFDFARKVFVDYVRTRPGLRPPATGRIRALAPASAR